jgi:membrane-associated phospholipid phosphatase
MILCGFLLAILFIILCYRLFRKNIFGAADEVELKFMDRCFHANRTISSS